MRREVWAILLYLAICHAVILTGPSAALVAMRGVNSGQIHDINITTTQSSSQQTVRKRWSIFPKAHASTLPVHEPPDSIPHDFISKEELQQVMANAVDLINKSQDLLKLAGWNTVHISDVFSLYKRRDHGAVVYLMIGKFTDISPRAFLFSQFDEKMRKIWDKSMKEMKSLSRSQLQAAHDSDDSIYFRTTWPFPLKDRDYVLGRR